MKILSKRSLLVLLACVTFAFGSSVAAAQDGDNGKHTGFEQGKHKGHLDDKGNHKGFENENNPFYEEEQEAPAGVAFDLTVHHHGLIPTTTFTSTYNSLMTIEELLAAILGDSSEGFYLQECYTSGGFFPITSCVGDETTAPIDSSLTLEQAGFLEDPEVHLVYVE